MTDRIKEYIAVVQNFSTTDKVTLETCTIVIDWQDFKAEGKFLDEVPVLTEITTDTRKTSGTTLEILTDKFWSPIEINSLILELRKLLPPDLSLPFEVKDPTIDEEKDIFKISLFLKDLNIDFKNETFNDKKVNIESIKRIIDDYSDDYRELKPAPIIDYFHYRIHGSISKVDGKLIPNLTFVNNYDGNNITKTISTKPIAVEGNCGLVKIDLRVFDGDKEGLGIIGSHLGGTYKSKEIQNILYEFAGVRVYKDKFRVRPYGGAGDDWLGLGTRRLSTPTERISSNQIIGLVWVEPEEKSGLEEKATREGFKDSQSFDTLKKIILIALSELEGRRLDFRIKAKKGGRSKDRTQENIDKTKEFDTLLEQIKDLLKDLPSDAQQKIEELIQVKAQQVSNTLEEVERMISVYQSKIMLGKMVAYLFHEGRPHLTSIKSKSRHVDHYIKKINQEISVLDIKHAEILTKNLDDTKESMNATNSSNFFMIIKILENKNSLFFGCI